jgi:hypothetical protein
LFLNDNFKLFTAIAKRFPSWHVKAATLESLKGYWQSSDNLLEDARRNKQIKKILL